MKHIFIVNPHAGAESAENIIREKLQSENFGGDFEIYVTKESQDATEYVKKCCEESPDEQFRFYACGGDGTLNEVASGAVGHANTEIACYPCGSGNDYVKYYGEIADFTLKSLKNGTTAPIDIILVNGKYAINACHFGFDSYVAAKMTKNRRKPLIGGKNAYPFAVACGVFRAMKNDYSVEVDGELLNHDGKMLLCTVANGGYVGGGYNCAPRSDNSDGLLEVCFVKPISVVKFLQLMGTYRKGQHLDDPRFEKYIEYRQAKTLKVKCPRPMPVSLDGEVEIYDEFSIGIEQHAIKFVVPEGLAAQKQEELV